LLHHPLERSRPGRKERNTKEEKKIEIRKAKEKKDKVILQYFLNLTINPCLLLQW
jgi:hypothetical protein